MKRLIKITRNPNHVISKKETTVLDPRVVYFPMPDDVLIDDDIKRVVINQLLYKDSEYSYTSSISGTINQLVVKTQANRSINCLEVINDYKERKVKSENIKNITNKNELLDILKKLQLFDLIKKISIGRANTIILDGIEDDIYIYSEQYYLKKYSEEILDTLDFLNKILKCSNSLVFLKNIDSSIIESCINIVGMYANIKLVLTDDKYLLGNKRFLCRSYNLDEKRSICFKPSELYTLHNIVNYNKNDNTRIISVVDLNKNKTYIVNTKKYVGIDEIFERLKIKVNSKQTVIKNSLMSGSEISIDKEIVTDDTKGYYIINNESRIETKCINCGKCHEICPIKIDPKYYMDNSKSSKNCIDCGLCSYVCPAYINLRKYLRGDKNE
jgi:electron transport complex protein RnfC